MRAVKACNLNPPNLAKPDPEQLEHSPSYRQGSSLNLAKPDPEQLEHSPSYRQGSSLN